MTRYRGARPGTSAGTGLTLPSRWAEQALCAQADPDAWFPDKGQHAVAKTAIRVCRACPVRAQCLDYALSGADTWGGIATGIWGGTTPAERDRLRQQRKAAAA
jgi:WhiB family transcriptional regulator, redox-sensing transcriptional regulator